MAGPFDQFDAAPVVPAAQVPAGVAPPAGNPFNQFDAAPQRDYGLFGNLVADAEKGLTGLVDEGVKSVVDIPFQFTNPFGDVRKSFKARQDRVAAVENFLQPAMPGHIANQAIGTVTGTNPESVVPLNESERIAGGVGAGLSSVLIPTGEALTVGRMLMNGLIGAGSGVASVEAQEHAPDWAKPVVGILAGVAGGVATHGAVAGASSAARTAAEAFNAASVPLSASDAERAAAATIAKNATDLPAVRASLEAPPQEIVPGSQPTTFQQTGDMGLGALERAQRVRAPDQFMQRAAEQNQARVGHLQSIEAGGDPNALASGIRQNFDALDQETQAHLDGLNQVAQANAAAIGGVGTPEGYGEQIRQMTQEAESAARTRERGLWQAVDPNNDLTGNVTQTREAAKSIAEGLAPTAKPMTGEEAGIFQAAAEMPALAPVNDLIALRSRVSTEMRTELMANGASPTYARLSNLRGAIQDNLATTIAQHIANEQSGVEAGAIAPEATTAAKIQGWINDFKSQRSQARATGSEGPIGVRGGGAEATSGADGAGLPPTGRPGGDPGNQGLSPNAGGGSSVGPAAPTFDEAAAARLQVATASTRERAQTFGQGAVGQVNRKAGDQGAYRLPEGRVPEKFFHPGPTAYSDLQGLYGAVGQERALPAIVDYAASSLRKAAMREDGTIDRVKFSRWSNQHQDALRALPSEVRNRFSRAADASQIVTEASAARVADLKAFQQGAIGRVMGLHDADAITRTVDQILHAKTGVAEMTRLADVARSAGPEAVQGLRQAAIDGVMRRYMSNTEAATSGATLLRADTFQTFVRQNKEALRTVFSPKEVESIQAVAQDIQQAKRSDTAVKLPGSNTAQDLTGAKRTANQMRTYLARALAGGGVGFAFHGPVGAAVGLFAAPVLQAMREAGISRIDELVTQAMLHPEIARELLKKAPPQPTVSSGAMLARAIRQSAVSAATASALPPLGK